MNEKKKEIIENFIDYLGQLTKEERSRIFQELRNAFCLDCGTTYKCDCLDYAGY